MTIITLRGVLNWDGKERRTDRYGGICLLESAADVNAGQEAPSVSLAALRPLVGRSVTVTAKVLEARDSYHVGDRFRGIKPSKPAVGDILELGRGRLMDIEITGGVEHFLFRRECRQHDESDWIDPHQLYRLHNQTVEITVIALQ